MKTKLVIWIFVMIFLVTSASGALTDDIAMYYSFDEDNVTGTTLIDLAGNYNGSCSFTAGGCSLTDGVLINGSYFDGTDDYVSINNGNWFSNRSYYTLQIWLNDTNFNQKQKFFNVNTIGNGMFMTWDNGDMYIQPTADNTKRFTYNNGDFNTSMWNHLVIVFNVSEAVNGDRVKTYLNGVKLTPTATNVVDTNFPVYAGKNTLLGIELSDIRDYSGKMDEVAIWDRVLSQAEILELYDNRSAKNPFSTPPIPPTSKFEITATDYATSNPINTFNATVNGTFYSTTNGTIVTNLTNNVTSIINITVNAANYLEKLYYHNVSSDLAAVLLPYMQINTYDVFTSNAITTFNATIDGTTYSTAATTLRVPFYNSTKNITLRAANYFERNYLNYNTSNNLNSPLIQAIINIRVKNIISGNYINDFYIEIPNGFNVNTTTGNALFNMSAGTWDYNLTTNGFENKSGTLTVSALDNKTITLYMNPLMTFNIIKESDGSIFNVSKTNSTEMVIFCPTKVMEYDFKGGGSPLTSFYVDCNWSFMKLDVTENGDSWFRTLIPDYTDINITWYAIEVSEEVAVQIILNLNDLTGNYLDGQAVIKRWVNGTNVEIIQQKWDVENKVNLYLIRNGFYTLSLISDTGEELNLGDLIADAAGTKVITVPDIEFTPDAYIGDLIQWSWQDSDPTRIRLIYNDTSTTGTTNLTFSVYDGASLATLYSTTSTSVSYAVYNYMLPDVNATYLSCFEAYHPTAGDIKDCREFYNGEAIGEWTGFSTSDATNYKNWIAIIVIVSIILGVGIFHISGAMVLASIIMWFFMLIDWLSLGSTGKDYTILAIFVFLTVLTFIIKGDKK